MTQLAGTTMRGGQAEVGLPPADAPHDVHVAGHELRVYVESPPLFADMVKDIQAARSRVWLETYIFFNDDGGRAIAEALIERARAGLDVRVLYDALGSNTTPAGFFAELEKAGVKLHCFHSLFEILRKLKPLALLNRRNHRKLLVVDERVAYFGGMNIIANAETVGQQKAEDKPSSSGWRDVHVRMSGPQVDEVAESFERSWLTAQGEKVARRSRAYRRAIHAAPVGGGRRMRKPDDDWTLPTAAVESIRFFDSGPGFKYSRAKRVFTRLLKSARFSVNISMAYFIPVGSVLRGLLAARKRRVRVRIVVPGKSDVTLVQRASNYLYEKLLRRGLRIYERKHRMLHSKVMVVDDQYTVVGSCNMDPRSLYVNLEFLAVIRSTAFATIINRIIHNEVEQSERITLAKAKSMGRWQRFVNSLAWSFRWWL